MAMRPQRNKNYSPGRRVGFYGCAGKVVRVELAEVPDRYPQQVRLESCPGCGHGHDANPAWRKYVPKLDDGKEAVVV
jgi:hypothetical protein